MIHNHYRLVVHCTIVLDNDGDKTMTMMMPVIDNGDDDSKNHPITYHSSRRHGAMFCLSGCCYSVIQCVSIARAVDSIQLALIALSGNTVFIVDTF